MRDVIYATVRCCRDWPIVFGSAEGYFRWRRCGECGQKPVLVEVDGKPIR